jgi:hypothetical protein
MVGVADRFFPPARLGEPARRNLSAEVRVVPGICYLTSRHAGSPR